VDEVVKRAQTFHSDPAPETLSELTGKPAPNFDVPNIDGSRVRLADLRGKVVFLSFWATWCGACLEGIPDLEKLQRELLRSDNILLGISDEAASVVDEWLKKYKRSFRTLVDARSAFEAYRIQPTPVLVVINKEGLVVDYVVGFRSENQLRELMAKHRAGGH
jgi:peroxiredoxin